MQLHRRLVERVTSMACLCERLGEEGSETQGEPLNGSPWETPFSHVCRASALSSEPIKFSETPPPSLLCLSVGGILIALRNTRRAIGFPSSEYKRLDFNDYIRWKVLTGRFSETRIYFRGWEPRAVSSLVVSPREVNPGRFSPDSIVLRFHQYIDKHSLSPLGAFREAPGENKQYALAVLARISLELPSVALVCACVHVHVKRPRVRMIKVGEVLCLYVAESARERLCLWA